MGDLLIEFIGMIVNNHCEQWKEGNKICKKILWREVKMFR